MAEIYAHILEDDSVIGPFISPEEADSVIRAMKDAGLIAGNMIAYIRTDQVCDFCSEAWQNPMWRFQIPLGGVMGTTPGEMTHFDMDGQWCACSTCKDLIVARENHKLAERSADTFYKTRPEVPIEIRSQVIAGIRDVHNMFFARWDGSAPTEENMPENNAA